MKYWIAMAWAAAVVGFYASHVWLQRIGPEVIR